LHLGIAHPQIGCMPQTLAQLHGLQHANATRPVTYTRQHNTTCSIQGIKSQVHHPQPAARWANRFGLHACSQNFCLRPCAFSRHHIKCFAARMAPARAAASAEAQSVVDSDLEEFVNLAKELAQAAGSITRQYFRCDQFAASLAFLVDHDNSTLAGSP